MKYDILHDLPGRLRVHCHNIHINPETRIELHRWMSLHGELLSVSLSSRTGNLLIVYNREAARASVLLLLDDLKIFGVAQVTQHEVEACVSIQQSFVHAVEKEGCALVMGAILPKRIECLFKGWKVASGLLKLFQLLGDGKFIDFCLGAAKCVALALWGKSIPIRLFIAVAHTALIQTGQKIMMLGDPQNAPPNTLLSGPTAEVECVAI